MTLIRPIETETAVEAASELTEDLFFQACSNMSELLDRLKAGDLPSETEAKKTIGALGGMYLQLKREEEKILEQRKRRAGIVGDYAIDFDALRAEIGSTLDRLRQRRASS